MTFTSQTTGICTVSGATVSYVGAGICTIAADQTGDANWNAALQATQTISVSKIDQTISFTPPAPGTFGGNASLVATATSGLSVAFASQTTGVCTVAGSTVNYVGVGTCTISANQSGDVNWNAATQVTQSATVGKADQTISSTALGAAAFNGSATLTASATSGLAVTFSSQTTGVCTVSGTTVNYVATGACTLAANQAGDVNWNAAAQVTQTTTVRLANQSITFNAPSTGVIGGSASLTASATSGLAVSLSSLTTSVCTMSGSTVTYNNAGTCTIAADQAGDSGYNPATRVTRSITVPKLSQTISFTGPGTGTFLASASLTATASSGLVVSLSSLTSSICTVSGTTVTYIGAGTCTIAANQAGDSNWSAATRVTQNVTIPKVSQTITFTGPGAGVFGGATTLTATSTSGLVVAFTSQTTSVCTVSGATVTYVGAGTCTIAANQAGNSNWIAATQVTQAIGVSKANQTISFIGPGAGTALSSATLSASATSGLAVVLTSQTTSVCTVSQSTVSYVGVGTCTIAANQPGSANWNASTQVTQDITVSKANQTIVFTSLTDGTFNGSATLGASATSGLQVSFSSLTTGVCTVSGTTVNYVATGFCTIAADQAGDAYRNAAPQVTQTIRVRMANQTIAFTGPGAGTYNGSALLNATATSGYAVVFTSETSTVCTVAGATVNYIAAGTCTIAADQPGDVFWNPAPKVTQNVTVAKASQTITFTGPATGALNAKVGLSATATSGLAVTLTSQTPAICSLLNSTVKYLTAGTCTVAADQAGDADWAAATQVTQNISVAKDPQTITFTGPGTGAFNSSAPLSATATSGLAVTFTSQTPAVCSVSGSTVNYIAAGTCIIAADQAGDANRSAAPQVTQSIAIQQAAQTIIFAPSLDEASASAGGSIVLNARSSSGLPVVLASTTPSVCSVSGWKVSYLAIGSCVITATQAGTADWQAATSVVKTIAVGIASSTTVLTVDNPAPSPGRPILLRAAVTQAGTLAVTGTVTFRDGSVTLGVVNITAGVASLSISSLAVGPHAITASYSGDANNASSVSNAVSVTPAVRNPGSSPALRSVLNNQIQTAARVTGLQINTVNVRMETLHDDNVPGFVDGISVSSSEVPAAQAYSPVDPMPYAQRGWAQPAVAALDKNAKPAAAPVVQATSLGPDYYVWTAGSIMTGVEKIDGMPNKARTTSQSVTVGIDTKLFADFKAGVAFGAFTAAGKTDDSGSKDRTQAFTASAYGSLRVGKGVFIDALVGYGDARFQSTRYDASATGLLTGTRKGNLIYGSLTASWDQKAGQLKYAPYARFDINHAWLGNYAEQGDVNWTLAYEKTTVSSQAAVVGLRAQYDIASGAGMISPTVRVEYRHSLSGEVNQTLSYVGDPTTSYGMILASSKSDTVTGSIGLKAQGEGNLSGQMEYSAGLAMQGGGFAGQGLRGSLRLGF